MLMNPVKDKKKEDSLLREEGRLTLDLNILI